MSDAPLPPPVNTTNELARERNRAAAERTLNAWTRICLGLIGFGVAYEQITRSLGQQRAPAVILAAPNPALVGMGFVGMGLLVLGLALVQHRLTLSALEQQGDVLLSIKTLNRWAVVAVVLVGMAGLGVTLVLP
jgi:putative membrane protein